MIDVAAHQTKSARGQDARALLGQTMGLVAVTAGVFALGTYLGRYQEAGSAWIWFVAALALLLILNAAARRSEQVAIGVLFGFGLVLGLAVSPTVAAYADVDPRAVWESAGATALFVAGLGAAGYATRRDLSVLARGLFWSLVALIAFGIVLVFIHIPGGAVIYAVIGLVVFAGLTMFDFQRLRHADDIRTAPLLAAAIFLDFLNVFLLFLSIFGRGACPVPGNRPVVLTGASGFGRRDTRAVRKRTRPYRFISTAARGVAASAVGTLAMDSYLYYRYKRSGGSARFRDWETSAGLASWGDAPAPAKGGGRTFGRLLGRGLPAGPARLVYKAPHLGV